MDQIVDIVELISNLLDSGKYKEALSVPEQEQFVQSFKDNCWDLISVIVSKVEDETIIIKPSLLSSCEELLSLIAFKAQPEEALLEFIEQIEVAKNDAQFAVILSPLQQILKKLITKRGRSLEWCLNAISTYIENIPIPEHTLEGNERLLLDCDSNVRRIVKVYSLIPAFYQPFIEEISTTNQNINIKNTKEIIAAFLISLLGKPLIYLDLDPNSNGKSEVRQCCTIILQDICRLEKNVFKFLILLESLNRKNKKSKPKLDMNKEELSPYEIEEKINMTTLSGLFYVVLSDHFVIPGAAIPQVYSPEYVVHTVMLSVHHLLSFAEFGPLTKAMALFKTLLNKMSIPMSHSILSSSIHYDICNALASVAIYSSYDFVRKDAVKLIGCFVNKFDYLGRYMLIKYLIDVANHSGMIGYAITLYKNSIDEAFKCGNVPDCFLGQQLVYMIKKICHLPHGAESDLVEFADQIITALNFLRYLVIKDSRNVTGIKDCLALIENDYLMPLRTGLNMSKAHYEVKLKDIEEGKSLPEEQVNVSVNVGGNVLDNIPLQNKKEIIISAISAFHLMEGLMARLAECINVTKLHDVDIDSLRNGRRYILPLTSISTNKIYQRIRNYSYSTVESNIEKDVNKVAVITTENEEHQYEDDVKSRILENALHFVKEKGWSIESLSAGAEVAGYPGITHGLFPNGGGDLVHYFNVKCNEELVAHMKSWPKEEVKTSKVPVKFLENAIMTRLLMIQSYKSTWPKAIALQALPNNVPNCLATLLSLVDDICYHSGDRSVDFNWYVRRVGLAGIYKTAELFYLTDNSQESNATRNFVSSRIRDAQLIQVALNMNPVATAPHTLTAAFVTAKNILGINTLK